MLSAIAAHPAAQFDSSVQIFIEGRVASWSYTNPHSWLYVEALDEKGEMQKWGFEGAAPIHAARQGVTGNTLPNDGTCNAPEVIERWKSKGWLDSAKHLDTHPTAD